MGHLHRRLDTLLLLLLCLSLLGGPFGSSRVLADRPGQGATLHRFEPWAPKARAPQSGALVTPKRLTPAPDMQPAAEQGRGYVPPPFDTRHLNDYPDVSALGLNLVAKWDWREQGKVTRVQDQGNCGACYAFATLGSMEAQSLIRDGTRYDFSENNLVECDYEQTGCGGGNIWDTSNRLSSYGSVHESCDPYSPADQVCNIGCPAVLVASEVWVLGGDAVPNTDVLKNWLQTYGPLYITMDAGANDAWGNEFVNYNGSYTLYHPMASPSLNHAVTLVGWNDDLSHAGGKGGWIVKNSWGTNWGGTCGYGSEKGYFTIAYGSAGLGSNPAVVRDWRSAQSAGKLLYLDEGGLKGGVGWNGTYGPYGLARLTPTQGGYATQVEFWTLGPTTADIAIYDSFDGQAPSGLLWQKQGISVGYAGYHSVNVDASVPVQLGNDIIVQVRFNTTGVYLALPVDNVGPAGVNQSFASRSGEAGSWLDMGVQGTPLDIGIRLRVGSGGPTPTYTPRPATPTPTYTPLAATPTRTTTPRPATPTRTYTPGPPTKTPTYGPSPTRRHVRLPMMLRQWTVAVQPTHTPWVITPTATPTTELEGDVYVLPNSHGYMDEGGGLHAVGEVQNDTGSILTDVLVTVHIYDDDGSWLASASNYVLLDRLLPGGHTCFHVYHEPIAGAYQFDIDSPDYSTTTEVPPSLVFTDHSARYDSGWIVIDGEVTNEEEQSVIDGRVVGAIYDAEYTVLGCEYCYLDNSDLGPGESSTFELTFTDRDYEDVLHYFIQAEGDWP